MIKTFMSKGLEELWDKGTSPKIDKKLYKRLLVRLDRLNIISAPEQMNLPGFDFHALQGHRPTRYSVHVNGPWCVTFEFEGAMPIGSISSSITD